MGLLKQKEKLIDFQGSISRNNNDGKRKRILLVWYEIPNRPELLEPFRNLADDFEFIHLYFNTPKERLSQMSPFKMIYWFDFVTPYKLIKIVKPDIIFSEFPSDLKTIALNVAAKNLNIPFISMSHGIYNDIDSIIPNGNSVFKINRYYKYCKIAFFYFSCIKFRNLRYIPSLLKFLYYFIKGGYFEALNKVKFKLNWPDKYIIYQPKNGVEKIKKKYNYPQEKIFPIGIPQFDSLFRYWNSYKESDNISTQNYYLLIDTAWVFNVDMPSSDMIQSTYLKLAQFCKTRNCKLFIKMHPHWYQKKDLPVDNNIVYMRNIPQEDLSELIIKSKGCFSYFSTLSLPIVPYKKCYFLYYKKPIKDLHDIISLHVAKGLNIIDFDINNIDFDHGFDQININRYIQDYLYSTDGNATKRLGQILSAAGNF